MQRIFYTVHDDFGPTDVPHRLVPSRYGDGGLIELLPCWYLRRLHDTDGRRITHELFREGKVLPYDRVRVEVQYDGEPLDFTLLEMSIPIVTRAVGDLLRDICGNDAQFIPAEVDGHPEEYEVVNVLKVLNCIDEAKSRFTRWTEANKRPDKVGQYKMMVKSVVDPRRVGDANLFRPGGWTVLLVVSQAVKEALAAKHVTGVKFVEAAASDSGGP